MMEAQCIKFYTGGSMNYILVFLLSMKIATAGIDWRKDPENAKAAKEAAMYIVKEGKSLPKGAAEMALDELKKVCTGTLHKGCYFWKDKNTYGFQPLNGKGEKDGKIYSLDTWLKKIFSK